MRDPYIFSQMHRIPGYLDPGDALILRAVLTHQNASGYAGGAAEIGIYYGRSWFLIRQMLRDGEKALAMDLFDMDAAGQSQMGAFLDHGQTLGIPVLPEQVLQADSATLSAGDILARTGPVRLFSVDGGHRLAHVKNDADLAHDCLSGEGVIVFDDFFNPEWPEVSAAVIDFLRSSRGALRPFAVSQKKLYVARARHCAEYSAAMDRAPGLRRMGRVPVSFFGHDALRIRHPLWRRAAYEGLSRLGLGRVSALLY
ncbi:class I SAM-dependent methyltransferase [Oceanibium sediminis]|uniref:class I SAM-dependent methyltransferase n=1 Tax=Oceanibium sediminis TaxID=2026339 RepID=UPI000DD34485|nr:class I SAM-dependent methyltransferase [Oceanibium sediminis]